MQIRKLLSSIAVLLLFSSVALAQEPAQETAPEAPVGVGKVFDMKACVERGLAANPAILAARAQLSGAEYETYSTFTDMLPSSTVNYGYTHSDRESSTTSSGRRDVWGLHLNVTQPLFPGVSLLNAFQKGMLEEEQADAQLQNAELTLIGEIQTTFLGLLKGRMNVKSAEDSLERLKSQLQVTTAYYEVGLKPRLDVLQAETDLATAEQELLTARNAVDTQTAKLNTLLNLPLEADVEYVGQLDERTFDLDLKQALAKAYANRPDIRIGEKSVAIARKDFNITASDLLPSVNADLDYYKKGNGADLSNDSAQWSRSAQEYWTAGVSMSYSLGALGSTQVLDTLKADQNVSQIMAELEKTKLDAGYEVKEALLNIANARDRIVVAHKSVAAATEAYRMALARYQAQVGTNTDVLDAQANVSSSEAELIQALADYQSSLSTLYIAMGEKNPGLETE
ncbi:TolC family protein [Paucidesulfovibrio longus]|uniref:TolC family protein n=1 Tax=Paucidesulfovibrio longus TaxID=889 RepID=UPI0003B616F6|nr:TolC family protein [Paucidesulfovibrio longus]